MKHSERNVSLVYGEKNKNTRQRTDRKKKKIVGEDDKKKKKREKRDGEETKRK